MMVGYESNGIHHQRVAFPMPDRIAVEGRLQFVAMLASIQRNNAAHALEFVYQHEIVLGLENLYGVGG